MTRLVLYGPHPSYNGIDQEVFDMGKIEPHRDEAVARVIRMFNFPETDARVEVDRYWM